MKNNETAREAAIEAFKEHNVKLFMSGGLVFSIEAPKEESVRDANIRAHKFAESMFCAGYEAALAKAHLLTPGPLAKEPS